jgi:putative transposase
VARFARVIAVDVAHHVTQRGNARRFILDCDADREVYLNLLWEDVGLRGVSLVGYCLMSNHANLIAIPRQSDDLSLALRHTHGRYASYWNARHRSSGHVWQGRYYSCPLDPPHLWQALRYTELNPVRAGLVREAKLWRWSSAAVHCGGSSGDDCLAEEPWHGQWTAEKWEAYLALGENEVDIAEIRQCTHTGRPLGTEEFIVSLEKSSNRRLTPLNGGRPRKTVTETKQGNLPW